MSAVPEAPESALLAPTPARSRSGVFASVALVVAVLPLGLAGWAGAQMLHARDDVAALKADLAATQQRLENLDIPNPQASLDELSSQVDDVSQKADDLESTAEDLTGCVNDYMDTIGKWSRNVSSSYRWQSC